MTHDAPVTATEAMEALDAMDDYARMACGVDAHGPRETLRRFIEQSAAPAAVVPADDSHEQTLWLRELFTLIEKWHETRDGTPSKAGAWMALWKHAHNIGPHWRDRAHLAPAHIDADKLHRDGWISVDDRLPEVGQEVLMWVAAEVRGESDDGREVGRDVSQVAMGMCMRGQDDTTYLSCYVSPFADFEHITHWMPLPTSPDRDARHAAAQLVSEAGSADGDGVGAPSAEPQPKSNEGGA